MSARFFDTNVITPIFVANHEDHEAALEIIAAADDKPVVSLNVLGEVFTNLTSGRGQPSGKPAFQHPKALEAIEKVERWVKVREVTRAHFDEAKRIKREKVQNFTIWDCLNWAVAKANGCTEIWTRDFPGIAPDRNGRVIVEGVEFVNPFGNAA